MNPIEITRKIKEVADKYNIVRGNEKQDFQLTVLVYYNLYNEGVWMEIGTLTEGYRKHQRESCNKRLTDLIATPPSFQTSRMIDLDEPDQVSAIRWNEGIVVLAGIGYLVAEDILAVTMYKLGLLTKDKYHKILEEIGAEDCGKVREEFKLLELSVPG